ncbi:shikimate kinase, partial [Bacillus thuringiensis]|nr:shikimate kinase [Bacillus thuringiensis]
NSREGEITEKNYIRINNTNLNATEVAEIIKKECQL